MDCDRNILLSALLDDIPCPMGFSVPKSNDGISTSDDLQIALERGTFSISAVIRQNLGQRYLVGMGVIMGAAIDSPCTAQNDFCNLRWKITPQIRNSQIAGPNNGNFYDKSPL